MIHTFQCHIWHYYRTHGRDLPWRNTKNPYHIFISEVMLQQTQVERVVGKYHAFIKEFPDFSSLAKAPVSSVLTVWQGLGYNRRALYLHRSATLISQHYHNVVPQDQKILDSLPGIGEATASSIIVFSYNLPLSFIETNIRRVYLHFFFPNSLLSSRGKSDFPRRSQKDCFSVSSADRNDKWGIHDKEIFPIIEQTLDRSNPREWYYGLMDYGAMLGKTIDNPNKRSAHYTRQSKFEGSKRQIRGKIVQLLVRERLLTRKKLIRELSLAPAVDIQSILYQLQKEGFIKEKGKYISIK